MFQYSDCLLMLFKGEGAQEKKYCWFLFPWIPFRDIFECGYFCKSFGRCMSLFMESLGQRRRVKAKPVNCWGNTHPFTSYFFKTLGGTGLNGFDSWWPRLLRASWCCIWILWVYSAAYLAAWSASLVGDLGGDSGCPQFRPVEQVAVPTTPVRIS